VVERVPVFVDLTALLLGLFLLTQFVCLVSAQLRAEGCVGHESLVDHRIMGAISQGDGNAVCLVASRGKQCGGLGLLLLADVS
jgi:hypothetical protein